MVLGGIVVGMVDGLVAEMVGWDLDFVASTCNLDHLYTQDYMCWSKDHSFLKHSDFDLKIPWRLLLHKFTLPSCRHVSVA